MANTFTCTNVVLGASPTPGSPTVGYATWTEGGTNGKRRSVLQGVLTTDGTKGAAAGDFPASMFQSNWTTVEEVTLGIDSTNSVPIALVPAYNYQSVINFGWASGNAANLTAGSYAITVKGY
jgi:hypothetical protein